MMQVPRACLRADAIVSGGDISFVSFGTNDLTQVGASSPISTTATSTSTYTAPPHSHPAPAPRPPPPALCVACTSAAVRLLARRLERLLAGLRGAPPAGRRPLRLRGRARRRCSHAYRRAGTPLVPPVPLDPLRGPVAPTAPTATHIPSAAAPCYSENQTRQPVVQDRRVRRARRRPRVRALLRRAGRGLRVVQPVPRAHRQDQRRAGAHRGRQP